MKIESSLVKSREKKEEEEEELNLIH